MGALRGCFSGSPERIATGMAFSLFHHNTRFFTGNITAFSIMLCHASEVGFALQISGPQNYCSFNSDQKLLTIWFQLKTCMINNNKELQRRMVSLLRKRDLDFIMSACVCLKKCVNSRKLDAKGES